MKILDWQEMTEHDTETVERMPRRNSRLWDDATDSRDKANR